MKPILQCAKGFENLISKAAYTTLTTAGLRNDRDLGNGVE
jgi:hypothetical protein